MGTDQAVPNERESHSGTWLALDPATVVSQLLDATVDVSARPLLTRWRR